MPIRINYFRYSILSAVLKILSGVILLVGLGSAWLVYQRAENVPVAILGYEQGDGLAYPVLPDDSKKYLRDLELYGGKANVLMDGIRRWFIGLWQGKTLAYTISVMTILISLGIFYLADHFPSVSRPDLYKKPPPELELKE